MNTLHIIKMVCKEDGKEVVYNNVELAEFSYGCLVTLFLEDGNSATFDLNNWELWDATPQMGWNCNIQ